MLAYRMRRAHESTDAKHANHALYSLTAGRYVSSAGLVLHEHHGTAQVLHCCWQIGRYFWVMLDELLNLLWEPEKQNERLIVMTTRLFAWGIRTSHLKTIGDGLEHSMRKTLGVACTHPDVSVV